MIIYIRGHVIEIYGIYTECLVTSLLLQNIIIEAIVGNGMKLWIFEMEGGLNLM